MIRGTRAAKSAPSWQDPRAVYPPTAVCGAFRMHGAHILPKPARFRMHGAHILPGRGDFPVRDRFRDAWGEKIATDCRPGTHRARILPLPVRPRTHYGAVLPPSNAEERISQAFCHRRAPGNAPWHNLAVAGGPKMHRGNTLPRQPPSRMLLDDILPRRPSTARACCKIAVVPRSRKTPPERSVGQFNTTR